MTESVSVGQSSSVGQSPSVGQSSAVGQEAGTPSGGPTEWINLPDVAEKLDVSISKVHQMIRERLLIAVRRDGVLRVPAELVANSTVAKHLPGVLTLLHDAGFNDEEALRWLYREDESLPGTPAAALGGDRAREVKRRAQAVAF